jgi:hypothetical protein
LRSTCAVNPELADLLLARATPGKPNECWPWPHALTRNGYGRVGVGRLLRYAHRLSFEAFNGPIPDGENVCHRCDNPPCWNPAHLFSGTTAENIADRDRKERVCRGERHHASRLSEDEVREIRASGLSGPELGRQYGVSPFTIYKILDGRSWKHVK